MVFIIIFVKNVLICLTMTDSFVLSESKATRVYFKFRIDEILGKTCFKRSMTYFETFWKIVALNIFRRYPGSEFTRRGLSSSAIRQLSSVSNVRCRDGIYANDETNTRSISHKLRSRKVKFSLRKINGVRISLWLFVCSKSHLTRLSFTSRGLNDT